MPTIAVAAAHPATRAAVHRALVQSDFTAVDAEPDLELLRHVFESPPAAVILGLDHAESGGFELIRILRAASDVPIVALILDSDPEMSARALDLGADDVAEHTIPAVELLARLRAAMRRSTRTTSHDHVDALVETGALVIDRTAREVSKRGQLIPLTRTEYRLLDALAGRLGQMAPHRFLLSTVWGNAYTEDTHYLRVYIGYLRAKLEDDPAHPRYLVNEWGMGYRLAKLPVERPGREPGREQAVEESDEPVSRTPD